MTKLVAASRLAPAVYNPREADEDRLALVELSLRKLGLLLPLYATPAEAPRPAEVLRPGGSEDGPMEIASGHQRHLVLSARLGWDEVPVEVLPRLSLSDRKALNILFNRATNDFDRTDTPQLVKSKLDRSGIVQLGEMLPDVQERYPCMHTEAGDVARLASANAERFMAYARNVAASLYKRGIFMPVVVGPEDRIVNGLGRIHLAREKKLATWPVVRVSAEQAAFAEAMLNWLSMDFALHTRYRDPLRYNSFRRARRVRKTLGTGFTFALLGPGKPAKLVDLKQASWRSRFGKLYGSRLLDFGAGHLHETEMLREAGFTVTPFEPYRLGHVGDLERAEAINKTESVALARAFLRDVAAGVSWTSVFCASVLNSVPFEEDRRHIARLLAACASHPSKTDAVTYACASSTGTSDWQHAQRGQGFGPTQSKQRMTVLGYEPGITLGDFTTAPKVQKFHTRPEFFSLFASAFGDVKAAVDGGTAVVVARSPRPATDATGQLAADLEAAIAFEFDLPYPDGSTMGLVREARDAFIQRFAA